MNDPVAKNFGRLVGRRMLMIPIMMAVGLMMMVALGVMLMLIGMVTGGSGSGIFVVAAVGAVFLFFAVMIGGMFFWAFRYRQKIHSNFESALGWLGPSRSYMLYGRQFAGMFMNRNVAIKVRNRPRGGGAVLSFEVPANLPGQLVIGTRTSVGKLIQGLTSSYEVTGTVFDQRNYALNTVPEHENFARWLADQPAVVEAVAEMMQSMSGYEIRAIRFENGQASMIISHPEAGVYQPEYTKRMMELLIKIVEIAAPQNTAGETDVQVSVVDEPSVVNAEMIADSQDPEEVISRIQVVEE